MADVFYNSAVHRRWALMASSNIKLCRVQSIFQSMVQSAA